MGGGEWGVRWTGGGNGRKVETTIEASMEASIFKIRMGKSIEVEPRYDNIFSVNILPKKRTCKLLICRFARFFKTILFF